MKTNYFELFNLPLKVNIDTNLLEENYYKQIKKHHPDINANNVSKHEQEAMAIYINEAYESLKHIKDRIKYIYLLVFKTDITSEQSIIKNNNITSLYFDLFNEMSSLQKKADTDIFLDKIQKKEQNLINSLLHINESNIKKNQHTLVDAFIQMQYIDNIKNQIKKTPNLL